MYDAANHFEIGKLEWSAPAAREAIQQIVDDHLDALSRYSTLPRHPLDDYGHKTDMYMGLAGVLWGIDYLQGAGVVGRSVDLSPTLDELLLANRRGMKDLPHPNNSSYLFGDVAILMQQFKLQKSPAIADAVYSSIEKNNSQPVRELMWGTAGTMLAATFMYRWTAEQRWKDIYRLQADRLLQEFELIDGVGHLWSPDLYGGNRKYLGPVHGLAGNVIPLIEGKDLLDVGTFEASASKVMETVVNTVTSNERHANWPAVFDASADAPAPRLVQHCHGAAGIVTALSRLPLDRNESFDEILEKGGELVWDAGPLKKGANLCHGTAGNGYAFLKLYQRTGNEIWLERARAFAMASIEQCRLAKDAFHQGRYTLWTGDLGTAFFLWDCIAGEANFPTIEIF